MAAVYLEGMRRERIAAARERPQIVG